ncbi:MAG: hypothetical protein RIR26_291 [Pseudomonadota bacterium]|jgi:hypothetical protein
MKSSTRSTALFGSLFVLSFLSVSCGRVMDVLSSSDKDGRGAVSTDTETQLMLEQSMNDAAGSSEPSLRPFPMDDLDGPPPPPEGLGRDGHRGPPHGPRGPRHEHGDHGRGKGPVSIPAEILSLMKAADAKKDTVLGIDRSKVDEILKAMRTDLEALRAIAVTRTDFEVQAKVIHDKYAAELRTVIPAFDTLTQEQKTRVKTIHDLQHEVIKSCVMPGADAASASCAAAKINLQADIDAP